MKNPYVNCMPFPVWLPSKKNPTFPNLISNKNACTTDHLSSITSGIVLRLVAEKMNLQEKNPFFSTIFSFQRERLNPAFSRVERDTLLWVLETVRKSFIFSVFEKVIKWVLCKKIKVYRKLKQF